MLMILSAGIHINFDPTFMSYLDIDTDTAIMFAKKGDDFTIMFQSIKIRAASLLMHRMQAGIDITGVTFEKLMDPSCVRQILTTFQADKSSRLCHNDGHADPPLKKDHLKKVVMNGAECSE